MNKNDELRDKTTIETVTEVNYETTNKSMKITDEKPANENDED